MKSIQSIRRLLAVLGFSLISTSILIGCSDDSSSDPVAVSRGYHISNGQCYDSSNQRVNQSYCNNLSNGYQLINGQCYNGANQIVSQAHCSNVTTTTGNTGTSCSGGVTIPGYGCIPRGSCSVGYVMWYGQCTYVGI
ncbi:MAG: hypothetical protein KDD37_03685 [Bdellovibrionales bacterium]|nr:hypothetical protein [Bdellovibrionales bacterium]